MTDQLNNNNIMLICIGKNNTHKTIDETDLLHL